MEQGVRTRVSRWAVLTGLALACGCASPPSRPTSPPPPTGPIRAVVFCADGAGGFGYTTEALAHLAASERQGMHVEMVPWSHGRGRMIIDHLDWWNIEEQARCLAERVRATQARSPALPIFFVGHSAGCAVLLEAASALPPDSVARIVLLAPSVSTDYDLRPALVASRCGIDAFLSCYDVWTLGLGMRLFGTTDRRWSATSGRVGFRRCPDPQTSHLYGRLREHFWDERDSETGHNGGHYGSYEPGFLRARVLPLLTTSRPPCLFPHLGSQ